MALLDQAHQDLEGLVGALMLVAQVLLEMQEQLLFWSFLKHEKSIIE